MSTHVSCRVWCEQAEKDRLLTEQETLQSELAELQRLLREKEAQV